MSEQAARKFYLKQFRAISNAIATYEDFNLLVRHLVEGVCRTFNIDGFVKSPIWLRKKSNICVALHPIGISRTLWSLHSSGFATP